MKNILIAATLAGIAGAATILYLRKRLKESRQLNQPYDPNDLRSNRLRNIMHNLKSRQHENAN